MSKPEYLIAIGASAGGLEAIRDFFDHMPSKTNLGFVVIQHLSPNFKSMMASLISRNTNMSISTVENDMEVEANTIYLIPPNKNLTLKNNRFQLNEQNREETLSLPINLFFSSMAEEYGDKSVGVILSGTGSDGSNGILDIYDNGGLIICQDPDEAKFNGMPKNAILTKKVDQVLSAKEMPTFITRHISESLELYKSSMDLQGFDGKFNKIFINIFKKFKIDLKNYKASTINRRIVRRMKSLSLNSTAEYLQLIDDDPNEVSTLFDDLIIGVTTFFRDVEAFKFLEDHIIPKLFEDKSKKEIRIWVNACSTGQEAYSIAMLIEEYLEKSSSSVDYKIFATDLVRHAIQFSSQGIYSKDLFADISYPKYKEYIKKYFIEGNENYQIKTSIRNKIIFSTLDVLSDPPFTNLDLVTCRNMLIYLKPRAQYKVLSNMHYGLNLNGYLFLGSSESLAELSDSFEVEHLRYKIFRNIRDVNVPFSTLSDWNEHRKVVKKNLKYKIQPSKKEQKKTTALLDYDHILKDIVSCGFIIDDDNQITHLFGNARDLIQIPNGPLEISSDMNSILGDKANTSIATALYHTRKEGKSTVLENVDFLIKGVNKKYNLITKPLINSSKKKAFSCLVLLEELSEDKGQGRAENFKISTSAQDIISDIRQKLQEKKSSLQATIEELETSNEELQSTNEELLSSNEELQSTNEELHSVNEELYTVNTEHQEKIRLLQELNRDIDNLLVSTGIGTIFVNRELEIRKFTPNIKEHFYILDFDIGRPIKHFKSSFIYPEMENDIYKVINAEVALFEKSVVDEKGRSFLMRVSPYLDGSDITGAVLSFVNIEKVKPELA